MSAAKTKKKASQSGFDADSLFPGYSLPLEYRTDGDALSLKECIETAKLRIQYRYEWRVEPRTRGQVSFDQFWQDLRLVGQNDPPLNRAELYEMGVMKETTAISGPEAFGSLYVAGILWFESLRAFQNGVNERSWAALVRCYYYLGMASGPESPREGGIEHGLKSKKRFDPFYEQLRPGLLNWIGELSDCSFPSMKDVILAVLGRAEEFRTCWIESRKNLPSEEGKHPWHSQNLGKLIDSRRRNSDPELNALILQKLAGTGKRGRPSKIARPC